MSLFGPKRETVDEMIDRLCKEHKIDSLELELQKFEPSKLTDKEKESWYLHWGIAAFRRHDRPEALRRFSEAYSIFPDSDQIRFSLGQEYEAMGDIGRMRALFHTCKFPEISSRHVLAISRYFYLWDFLDEALNCLDPIFSAYFTLGVVDDNFVHMRGLPFFSETWSYYLCYAILRNDFTSLVELTHRAKSQLSQYSFDHLLLFLDCCKRQDFDAEIHELEKSLRNQHPLIPTGYKEVRLASLKSLNRSDDSLLTETILSQRDFPWLADILLIHRARIADIEKDHSQEQRLIEIFMNKQPRLFEPNHAADFAFAHYQETLKPLYQRTRQP